MKFITRIRALMPVTLLYTLAYPTAAFGFEAAQGNGQTVAQFQKGAADFRRISVEPGDAVLPQLVDGNGWQTSIILTNLDSIARHYVLMFFDDSGDPMDVPIVGSNNPTSGGGGVLQPNQTFIVETTGTASALRQGYAILLALDRPFSDPASQPVPITIGGYGIFRQRIQGRPDFEAVVPLVSLIGQRATVAFDNRNGFSTGVALVNSDPTDTSVVTVTARDLNGSTIRTDTITLRPGTKATFSVPARYPDLANRIGILQISTPASVSALGLRFNPSGPFTSMHPLSLPR